MPEQGKNRPAKGKGSGAKPPPKEHQFKKGDPRINRKGRPVGSGYRTELRDIMDEVDPKLKQTKKERLARKLVSMGLRGNIKALELIDKQLAAMQGDTPRDGPAIVFEIVERKADERKGE